MFTFEPGIAIWNLITFGLVVLFVYKKVYPIVAKVLTERRDKIVEDLQFAKAEKIEAERHKGEYEERLAKIQLEEQQILSEARERAKGLYDDYVAKAMAEFREFRQQKETDLKKIEEVFFQKAENRLALMVVQACEKILRTKLTPEQQQEIIQQRLVELKNLKEI